MLPDSDRLRTEGRRWRTSTFHDQPLFLFLPLGDLCISTACCLLAHLANRYLSYHFSSRLNSQNGSDLPSLALRVSLKRAKCNASRSLLCLLQFARLDTSYQLRAALANGSITTSKVSYVRFCGQIMLQGFQRPAPCRSCYCEDNDLWCCGVLL